jgi:predicted alpha/beta superfamily hydrolase
MPKAILSIAFTVIANFALSQTPATAPGNSKPFVLGVTETLRSGVLREERTLNIYLPEGYNANDTAKYAVIYLLDGAADEDFIHVVGAVQFLTFPWIERIPPSIVVGIANTDRRRDFTYPTSVEAERKQNPTTGGSAAFIRFLAEELQPYIEKKYRVTTSRTLVQCQANY